MSKASKFKILPKHMLVSNRDFPIGNACNNNFELWCQELSSAKDTIWAVTDRMSCHNYWLHSKCKIHWTLYVKSSYVTKKMTIMKWLPQIRHDKAFPRSCNQQMVLKISYNFSLFVSYDYHSYHRIEFDVMCPV